jgi:hypothetical protein
MVHAAESLDAGQVGEQSDPGLLTEHLRVHRADHGGKPCLAHRAHAFSADATQAVEPFWDEAIGNGVDPDDVLCRYLLTGLAMADRSPDPVFARRHHLGHLISSSADPATPLSRFHDNFFGDI